MTTDMRERTERLPLDDYLCFAVYSAGHAFNRIYKPLLDALGLTYPQYLALVALWDEDDQTVGQIGEKLFLESSTLTPLLKRLEASGHITRQRDAEDERVVRVRLTPKGKALSKTSCEISPRILAATGMEVDALRALQRQIVALRDGLRAAAP